MTPTVRDAASRPGRTARRVAPVGLLVLALAGLVGCGTPEDLGPLPSLPGTNTTVSTTNGFYGQVLSDGAGRTLYQFTGDPAGTSTCYGPCAQVWQPYIAQGQPQPDYVNLNAFRDFQLGLVAREDGTEQVSYDGRPLYFYSGDQAPADVAGVGREEFGGQWFGVTTLGNPVIP